MSTSSDAARAEQLLDRFAEEMAADGLMEFVDFYMPHRATSSSPLPASEIFGIRYDPEAEGFEVYFRDSGTTRVLVERAGWDEARALYLEKVTTSSPFGKRKP